MQQFYDPKHSTFACAWADLAGIDDATRQRLETGMTQEQVDMAKDLAAIARRDFRKHARQSPRASETEAATP